MQGKIKIQIKNVYGTEKAYPVDTSAELFARIAGTKTLARHVLSKVLEMGLSIEVVDRYGNVSATFRASDESRLPAVM